MSFLPARSYSQIFSSMPTKGRNIINEPYSDLTSLKGLTAEFWWVDLWAVSDAPALGYVLGLLLPWEPSTDTAQCSVLEMCLGGTVLLQPQQGLWWRSGEAGLVSSILQSVRVLCSGHQTCAVALARSSLTARATCHCGLQCWAWGQEGQRGQAAQGCAASWAPAPGHPPRTWAPQPCAQFELQWLTVPERPQCLHTMYCIFYCSFSSFHSLHCVLSIAFFPVGSCSLAHISCIGIMWAGIELCVEQRVFLHIT